ncbi:hypothetical protein BWO91_16530 [Plantibacter flavus]|uniref:hypothetical protein n=1 Tax=Plantibacter flavus TaxID=150123 RepID=UPI00099D69B2|nr:hypothetical protein [Plantibacter flavus]AQX81354.1 hypothetical protein BWO91_16530 [Plantibacter flavus]
MSASATTESTTISPAEDVTLADAPTEAFGPEPLTQATPVPLAPVPAPTAVDRESSTQTLSIIAFALSIAAVVAPSFVLLPIASLVLGIIALARKPKSKGFALTAVIISGTMLALALIVAAGAALLLGVSVISGGYAG